MREQKKKHIINVINYHAITSNYSVVIKLSRERKKSLMMPYKKIQSIHKDHKIKNLCTSSHTRT